MSTGLGLALGAGLGILVGVLIGNVGVGIAIGAGLGIVFGAAFNRPRAKDDESDAGRRRRASESQWKHDTNPGFCGEPKSPDDGRGNKSQ